jgi:hypothetical protein
MSLHTVHTKHTVRTGVLTTFVLVLAVGMAGCMRVDRAVQVNSDGSGIYTLTIAFRQPRAGDPSSVPQQVTTPMEAFGAHVRQTGGSALRTDDQGYAIWTFTRPFVSVGEADQFFQEDPRQNDPNHTPILNHDSLHIVKETRFSSAVFRVTGTLSLVDLLNTAHDWRDATERVSITLAGGVLFQRGGLQQGNTVTYTIHYNESATVDVEGRVGNASDVFFTTVPLLLEAVLLLASVLLLVLGVRLLHSARARAQPPRKYR